MGINKTVNPKGIGLLLSSYCNLYSVSKDLSILEKMHKVFSQLIEISSKSIRNNRKIILS
jgi:hypothetical protein